MVRSARSRDPILVLGLSGQVYKNTNPIKLDYKVCAKSDPQGNKILLQKIHFKSFLV